MTDGVDVGVDVCESVGWDGGVHREGGSRIQCLATSVKKIRKKIRYVPI